MHWIKVELASSWGHNTACRRPHSTCWPCTSGHRLASLEGCHRRRYCPPRKTKPHRSGFYLVLSNDKSLPHSTASAAGTCWRPSVKGIVYVVGDPELITIPPSPIHYCSSLLIWRIWCNLSWGAAWLRAETLTDDGRKEYSRCWDLLRGEQLENVTERSWISKLCKSLKNPLVLNCEFKNNALVE